MPMNNLKVFTLTIASGSSQSAAQDLGGTYAKVMYDCTGAGDSSHFLVSNEASGTYRIVKYTVASGMSAPQTMTVGSACSGSVVEVPELRGHRFVKVVVTAGVANGAALKLYCSDY